MRKRGMTLVELLVATAIAMFLLAVLTATVRLLARGTQKASTGYSLGQNVFKGTNYIKADLFDTALASVRVFPSDDHDDQAPGLSLLSAHPMNESGSFQFTAYGSPGWQKHIFYTLQKMKGNPERAQLVRWGKKLSQSGGPPIPSTLLPDTVAEADRSRAVLNHLLPAGHVIKPDGPDGMARVHADQNEIGGFQVRFLRYPEGQGQGLAERSSRNPTTWYDSNGDEATTRHTRLIEVKLTFVKDNEKGMLDSEQMSFRVCPRN
jgi:type II secretory pathway component PulJ